MKLLKEEKPWRLGTPCVNDTNFLNVKNKNIWVQLYVNLDFFRFRNKFAFFKNLYLQIPHII